MELQNNDLIPSAFLIVGFYSNIVLKTFIIWNTSEKENR